MHHTLPVAKKLNRGLALLNYLGFPEGAHHHPLSAPSKLTRHLATKACLLLRSIGLNFIQHKCFNGGHLRCSAGAHVTHFIGVFLQMAVAKGDDFCLTERNALFDALPNYSTEGPAISWLRGAFA